LVEFLVDLFIAKSRLQQKAGAEQHTAPKMEIDGDKLAVADPFWQVMVSRYMTHKLHGKRKASKNQQRPHGENLEQDTQDG